MEQDRLTTKSQEAVSAAVRRAVTEGHPEVRPVHLLLALLDQPSAGVVAMDGRPVSQLKAAEISQLRNERFGFVFQQFFLNPNQTVLENTVLPLKIAGVGRAERTRRGMAVLERLELADKAKNKATDLSGG